jgi:hypothetical protein
MSRSTIELATSSTKSNERVRLQRHTAAAVYNDAKAYFDQTSKNLSYLTQLSEGVPIEIASYMLPHFKKITYDVNHKLGIGHMDI